MIFTAKVITQSASVLLLIKPTDWSTKPLQVVPTCSCIQVVFYDFYCEGCSKCQCAITDDANGLVCEAFFFFISLCRHIYYLPVLRVTEM